MGSGGSTKKSLRLHLEVYTLSACVSLHRSLPEPVKATSYLWLWACRLRVRSRLVAGDAKDADIVIHVRASRGYWQDVIDVNECRVEV